MQKDIFLFTNDIYTQSLLQLVIMAVALVPDQAIFEYIYFSEIGARFMDERQECTR